MHTLRFHALRPTMTRRISALLLLAVACTGDTPSPDRAADSGSGAATRTAAPAAWVVRPDSFGRLPLGVPLAQAVAALADSIPVDFGTFDSCGQVTPAPLPRGTSLMILRDSVGAPVRVERVDVAATGIPTAEGAMVGDSEERVLALYGVRARVEPHKYTGPEGHYLVVTSPGDTLHRIVFETDGLRVLRYRAGRRPAVEYVEGCA
ncbi:MAG TPA: hypothetical protein VFN38_11640, partial [Gemmatimonadaceae bacterium]|nr:hypothetical protein [Gemmatimonadaceae bacterium]